MTFMESPPPRGRGRPTTGGQTERHNYRQSRQTQRLLHFLAHLAPLHLYGPTLEYGIFDFLSFGRIDLINLNDLFGDCKSPSRRQRVSLNLALYHQPPYRLIA